MLLALPNHIEEPPGRWTYFEKVGDQVKEIGPAASFNTLLAEVNRWFVDQGKAKVSKLQLEDWLCRRAGGSKCVSMPSDEEPMPLTIKQAVPGCPQADCRKGTVR